MLGSQMHSVEFKNGIVDATWRTKVTARGQASLKCSDNPDSEAWLAPSIRGHAVVANLLVDHGMSETVNNVDRTIAFEAMIID